VDSLQECVEEAEQVEARKPLTEGNLKAWNQQQRNMGSKTQLGGKTQDLDMRRESERKVIAWKAEFNPPEPFKPEPLVAFNPRHTPFKEDSPNENESPTRDGVSPGVERPRRTNPFADLETTWPESHGSSSLSPQRGPVVIRAAGQVEAGSGGAVQTGWASGSATPQNGMNTGRTVVLLGGLVLLIGGAVGLGRWAWNLLRKRRRDDDDDTDVEEEIDVNGDTEDGGSEPTRKLRKRYHVRDWISDSQYMKG
jgi:hypothetical protein